MHNSNNSNNSKKNWIISVIGLALIVIIPLVIDLRASIQAGFPVLVRSGNTNSYTTFTGSLTSGNCIKSDANGNLVDTGGACGGGGIVTYSGPSLTLTGTLFFPVGGGGSSSGTESNVDVEAPSAATITNFYVQLNATLTSGTAVFTWRKNAANTSVTCTITNPATTCNDSTHSFTTVAGDLIDIQVVLSNTTAAATVVMATQFGTTGSSGTVNNGTQFQIGQYASTGTAISGVTLTDCPDTGGNHLNRSSSTGVWSCGTSSTGGTKAPSYGNPLGTGDRTGGIVVTGTISNANNLFAAFPYNGIGQVVIGINATNGFWAVETLSGKTIIFDFGTNRQITEATYKQSTATAQGTWQWAGSTDNVTYTDIGANFTIAAATSQALTELSTNVVQYRYYRMTGVSGSSSNTPFVYGMYFKIDF